MNKLSLMQVLEIATSREPVGTDAAQYGVSTVMIWQIRNGHRYSMQTGIDPKTRRSHPSSEQRDAIRLAVGTNTEIAARFSVHESTVRRLRRKPT